MMKKSKTIVFFGTDEFSLATLRHLFKAGYNIGAVVTKPDSKSGRGQKIVISAVKAFAINHNIPVWQPTKVAQINDDIKALGPNIVGILVSFGKLIPESTINLFNPGIINIHPSLLPLYRGSTPIESAIKNGDKQTGVSIMQLVNEMDAGPVYKSVVYDLNDHTTSPQLYETLAEVGAETILEILPSILDGQLLPAPQNNAEATFCNLLTKQQAWIDPAQATAAEIERQIRAFLIFPKSKINIQGKDIIITKAHVSKQANSILDLTCKQGDYLSIDELIAPSGRKMSGINFLNGLKN